ncbi:DNA cytosine methyltransferase [Synechococcus moorigangaii CMS01]|nr:DNA cytosine methyltransferase [Synechococcus moorigangaii CMS01]
MLEFRGGRSSVSLFSGAGGMDVGFARAGFESVLACEIDRDACETFNLNLHRVGHRKNRIEPSSVTDLDLRALPSDLAVVFGGPPCQGFSVAGKMDPDDERSQLIHSFIDVVEAARPRGFVCENVKALAISSRWEAVRRRIFERLGVSYRVALVVLNASEFGVPQIRERMFLVGIRKDIYRGSDKTLFTELSAELARYRRDAGRVADIVRSLGKAGTSENPLTCTAKISYAKAPVLRRSPYAGMLFNGAGRPLPANGCATTLPASMGGNKTPIIDEGEIFDSKASFVEAYHAELRNGAQPRSGDAPRRLRRLTIRECMAIQTFPPDYQFHGRKSSIYRQIGNAVPCDLAEAVARSFRTVLSIHEAAASDAMEMPLRAVAV